MVDCFDCGSYLSTEDLAKKAIKCSGSKSALVLSGTQLNQIGSLVGIAPTNTAAQNVTAFNDALTRGNLTVDTAGVYELDDTIFIPSNRTLTFVEGCTLRKKTGSKFLHVIANKGILSRTWNSNIKVFGNGVNIDINEIAALGTTVIPGLVGHFAFFQVNNFIVDGLTTTTNALNQFFMQFAEVDYGIISNPDIAGWKDAIHMGRSSYIDIINPTIESGDDGIALNAVDYPQSNPTCGNIDHINIIGLRDKYHASQGGAAVKFISGSWDIWHTGIVYQSGDTVISNGRMYRSTSTGTSSIAPTHLSGSITGGDSITWLWVKDSTDLVASVTNITITDPKWESARILAQSYNDESDYVRCVFPGTFGNGIVDNIIIDGIIFNPYASSNMISLENNVGHITIKNSNIESTNNNLINVIVSSQGTAINKITYDNCNLKLHGTQKPLSFVSGVYSLSTVELINGTILDTPDANRTNLFNPLRADQLTSLIITDSTIQNIESLVIVDSVNSINTAVTAFRSKFIGSVKKLVSITNSTGTTIVFNADYCEFSEPFQPNYLFNNNISTCQLNVITTNSITPTIPNIKSGSYVNVSGSDLVAVLGDNVYPNGDFKYTPYNFSSQHGSVSWGNSDSLLFTADGVAGANYLIGNINNPLSTKIVLRFKAKSPTATNTLNTMYNGLSPVINPALSSIYQQYEFSGDRTVNTGNMYWTLGNSLPNGTQIYLDNITVIEYI